LKHSQVLGNTFFSLAAQRLAAQPLGRVRYLVAILAGK